MRRTREGGFALPVAIFALVIAATVITAGTFVARQETKIGTAVRMGSEAFYLAEAGMNELMADWPLAALASLALGADTTITDTIGSGLTSTRVTRVGSRMYLMESTSEVTEGGALLSGASREAGMVVRLFSANIDPPAALTTRGDTDLRGNAEVHGEDQDPTEWGGLCDPTQGAKPGILTDDQTLVQTQGVAEITGSPAVERDPDLNDSTFTQFGGMSYQDLVDLADKIGPTGTINGTGPAIHAATGRCDLSVNTNWGDPLNPAQPCGNYFPLIHVPGSVRIQSGGVGQGIMLVDGDLDLRGDFIFYGIIIVQGNFETQGNGNRVYGAVLASNATLEDQTITGGSVIDYSSCAATRAVLNNSSLTRPRPLAQRSWVDLSAVKN